MGGFNIMRSFVGVMSDVHMWVYILSQSEMDHYMGDPWEFRECAQLESAAVPDYRQSAHIR